MTDRRSEQDKNIDNMSFQIIFKECPHNHFAAQISI